MRVGLTGNFASGKSTVSRFFEKFGAVTVDTDIVAREIVEPGTEVYTQIIDHFGKDILMEDGIINRRKLGDIVFAKKEELAFLESISHPAILKETLKQTQDKSTIFMINVPLLFQTNFHLFMDKKIIVTADTTQLIERGAARDKLNTDEVESRLKNQININEFLDLADYIIDNTMSLEKTEEQVKRIWINITTTTT